MSWKAYPYQGIMAPLMGRRGGMMNWRRMARGVGRGMMRGRPWRRTRSFCCCCPVFLALGVAALGAVGGFLYLGVRFLGWA